MKNEPAFLEEVYSRAAAEKARIRQRRNRALLSVLVLIFAVPCLYALGRFLPQTVRPQNEAASAQDEIAAVTDATLRPEYVTEAPYTNVTPTGAAQETALSPTEAPFNSEENARDIAAAVPLPQEAYSFESVMEPPAGASSVFAAYAQLFISAEELQTGGLPVDSQVYIPEWFVQNALLAVFVPQYDWSGSPERQLKLYDAGNALSAALRRPEPNANSAPAVLLVSLRRDAALRFAEAPVIIMEMP